MSKFSFSNLFLRVSPQDQMIFVKNLAVMTKAGMPLLDSLRMLQKQSSSRSLSKIITQLTEDLANGQFLATSLERYRNIFGEFAINIIRVGEASGILYENLNYLSEELKKTQELKRKVLGAVLYPVIIAISTFSISGVLAVYIFPKILPVFKSLKIKLPLSTRILMHISDFLINYGFYFIGCIVVFIIAIWFILKIKSFRFFYHKLLLYIPLFGKLSQNYNMANFTRTLGLLLKSDIKVVEALSITADTLTNQIYRKEIKNMAEEISKGENISKHLERKPKLFPLMASQLVAIGETTGNLSETLVYLSEFYENELDQLTKNLSTVLEPLLMVTMGVLVGFIAISIITPIYEITQVLRH